MSIVLDASALAKVFLDEDESPAFRTFLEDAIEEEQDLVAPRLIAYELGNIITAQFPEADRRRREQTLKDTLTLVREVQLDDPGQVFRFVEETESYYDAVYLWVTRREEASLVTYDNILRKAAETHDVPLLRP